MKKSVKVLAGVVVLLIVVVIVFSLVVVPKPVVIIDDNNLPSTTPFVVWSQVEGWGPCPEQYEGACTAKMVLQSDGNTYIQDGNVASSKMLTKENVARVIDLIKTNKLYSPECFVQNGVDYFVTYDINDGVNSVHTTDWVSAKCDSYFTEIKSVIRNN